MSAPSFELPPNDANANRSGSWGLLILFLLLAILLSVGTYLFSTDLIQERRDQERRHWGERNQSIAAAKVELLSVLLSRQHDVLDTFANFDLVKVYVQEVQMPQPEGSSAVLSQKPYLDVLLQDFKKQHKLGSLTVVDKSGRLLLGSALIAPLPKQLRSSRSLVDVQIVDGDTTLILYRAISESQKSRTGANAYVVSTVNFDHQLKKVLVPLPLSAPDEVTSVAMQAHDGLYQVQLEEGALAVRGIDASENIGRGNLEWMEGAIAKVGYLDPVPSSPFAIQQSVSEQTVFASVYQFRRTLIVGFILVSLALLLFALLVWRQGAAMRHRALAIQYRDHAAVLDDQKSLLRSVIDSIPDWIGVKDQKGQYFLFNRAMQNSFELNDPDDHPVAEADLFSAQYLSELDRADSDVLRDGKIQKVDIDLVGADSNGAQEASYLSSIRAPFLDGKGAIQGVVALTRDVTTSITAQRRIRSSIDTTMKALCLGIEANDPFFANHSRRVAELVDEFHRVSPLSEEDRMTCHQCASLLAVERAGLPTTLLHKQDELSEEERRELQSQDKKLAELLSDLDFDLPVLDVLGHLGALLRQESVVGSSADIEHMAHILMITNAWCAMTAPRSWRGALNPVLALGELRADPDRYTASYVETLACALKLSGKTES